MEDEQIDMEVKIRQGEYAYLVLKLIIVVFVES